MAETLNTYEEEKSDVNAEHDKEKQPERVMKAPPPG